LVFAGILAVGIGIVVQANSVLVLACATIGWVLGAFGLLVRSNPEQWDSIRLVLAVGAAVSLLATILVALPRLWRRIAVSLLIVLHFAGILSTVMSAQPGSTVAGAAYVHIFRTYLEFFYLTNAYHFYAPEPGPAYLLWFRIEYTKPDEKAVYWHWHKVPDLDVRGWPRYPLALQYQRRLALASLSAQSFEPIGPDQLLEVAKRHENANLARYEDGRLIIPRNPSLAPNLHYHKPPTTSQRIMSSYVRHVAYAFEQEHPGVQVKRVKIYRIIHYFLSAPQMAADVDPQDPTTYHPYFWGEYDADGKMTPASERDPYLYWQLPFLRVQPEASPHFKPNSEIIPHLPPAERPRLPVEEEDQFSIDVATAAKVADVKHSKVFGYMYLHAGDTNWVLHAGARKWTSNWRSE
jgi:hypothetical protein